MIGNILQDAYYIIYQNNLMEYYIMRDGKYVGKEWWVDDYNEARVWDSFSSAKRWLDKLPTNGNILYDTGMPK